MLTMVNDHGIFVEKMGGVSMETIAVSKFKATCLSLLERVKNTREPILITKKGVPIAQVVPLPEPEKPMSWFGRMKGTCTICGEIVSPTEGRWEVLDS